MPQRLAEFRASANCLGFPCASEQCSLPEGAPEGDGMGAGHG